MAEKISGSDHFKGWLWKWTNYVKGYQKRWFVLSNGLLSYYKSQAEVTLACRGTIILAGATISTEDSCHFTISNGSAHRYHLKASSEVERQRWITVLELAKSLSSEMLDSEESSDEEDFPPSSIKRAEGSTEYLSSDGSLRNIGLGPGNREEYLEAERNSVRATLSPLDAKLVDLETCNKLIGKHGTALLTTLGEFESEKQYSSSNQQGTSSQNLVVSTAKLKAVNERAMLFRITSSAMISACTEFLDMAKSQSKKWQKMLTHEREQRLRLEETVETLAKQHNNLERALNAGTGPPKSNAGNPEMMTPEKHLSGNYTGKESRSGKEIDALNNAELSEEDDEFLDAYDEPPMFSKHQCTRNSEDAETEDPENTTTTNESTQSTSSNAQSTSTTANVAHRTRIPFKPNYQLNLWAVMKSCIGKDLSKIPVPVNFNEPLSMLQRLSEDLGYSDLLDKAAACTDSCEQLALVVAFSVSSYSTTLFRTGKPFNPLLGETFESDRTKEFGYKLISEQVSHHPPAAAFHAESIKTSDHGGWSLWQDIMLSSKFRGKYLTITPLGTVHVKFHATGHHYTWKKVTVTIHNIIVGKLWVDQSGESNIVNHTTGDHCKLTYFPYSYFVRDTPRKVTGTAIDKDGVKRYSIFGTWDASMKCKRLDGDNQQTVLLWQNSPLPPLADKMYFFTKLALILNEWEDGTAPTDSRRRPDQRKMEQGAWDEANKVKQELEERQRARRKMREAEVAQRKEKGEPEVPYKPKWFKKVKCPITQESSYMYNGGYWEAKEKQDWSDIPDIFNINSSPSSSNQIGTAQVTNSGRLTPSFTKSSSKKAKSNVPSATKGQNGLA